MLLVVVLFGVAPGFGGGLEAEAFLFHGGILASRLLKRKKQKKKNVHPSWTCWGCLQSALTASPP
jgi:hypothetical protein